MVHAKDIEAVLREGLPADAFVRVDDPMNDGTHLHAVVVTAAFEGLPSLKRHRMVYAALGDLFSGPLHALQFRTLTPQEAEKQNVSINS